jgi:RNA polymerase-binding transcription factor DksA
MSSLDAEAREVLLRRRRSLSNHKDAPSGDPSARWRDYEATLESLSEAARREVAEIDEALARIQQGSYGRCLSCGGPMGLQRLRAVPEARYCLGCSGHFPAAD